MSCVPPHLLQRATILYRATELFVVSGSASCMPSFSCMAARIVRCFGRSVKDKERAILATRPVATDSKIESGSLSPAVHITGLDRGARAEFLQSIREVQATNVGYETIAAKS
jgi:hypothetical protein